MTNFITFLLIIALIFGVVAAYNASGHKSTTYNPMIKLNLCIKYPNTCKD